MMGYSSSSERRNVFSQLTAPLGAFPLGDDPAIGARLASGGLIARTNTAAEFGEIIEHERAKVAAIARAGDGKAKR